MSSKHVITLTKSDEYIFNGKTYSKKNLADMILNGTLARIIQSSGQIELDTTNDSESTQDKSIIFNTQYTSKYEYNKIIFGAPGTGKSYTLNEEKKDLLLDGGVYERVTFHADYSYAKFVGTYKPIMREVDDFIPLLSQINTIYDLNTSNFVTISQQISSDFEEGRNILLFLLGIKFPDISNKDYFLKIAQISEEEWERNINASKLIKKNNGQEITYEYVPGPFMRIYVKALKNARTTNNKPHLLIIEEINRANVSAVFGDVFQLLDRDENNVSEYGIEATEDMKKYLAKELGGNPSDYSEIKIPNNMLIWATMNSADQGVFHMDTAFKRRWTFQSIGIDDGESKISGKKVKVGKGDYECIIEWNQLRKAINDELLEYKLNEDKLLGPFFLSMKSLETENDFIDSKKFAEVFKNKVIMYLFEDAAKHKRQKLFSGVSPDSSKFSSICQQFDEKGIEIFNGNICSKMKNKQGI